MATMIDAPTKGLNSAEVGRLREQFVPKRFYQVTPVVIARAERLGQRIEARFQACQQRFPQVGESRGLGAMRAGGLVKDRATRGPAGDVVAAAMEEAYTSGLIVIKASMCANVIRMLPPLTISNALLGKGLAILESSLATAIERLG